MLYGVALSALAAASAWLLEASLAACGRARRHAWTTGIVVSLSLPLAAVLFPRPLSEPLVIADAVQRGVASPAGIASDFVPVAAKPWFGGVSLDHVALTGWIIASSALLAFYLLSLARLARQSRRSPKTAIGSAWVTVTPDVGPAVFGWFHPHVVFPRWLLTAPGVTQEIAFRHEHLLARDPQVLTTATLLFALFPWNAPLLWMLRRLRFAMEVDCDARVVRGGVDPAVYGEALLYVSQRQAVAPATSIALIERPSQLERRINIMFASPRKYPVLVAGLGLVLAASCLFAATNVDAPARAGMSAPLKPAPTPMKLGGIFEQLLASKFPGLLEQEVDGTPVVVVLINEDLSIARAEKFISPEPMEQVHTSKATFAMLGLDEDSVPYVGNMGMRSPHDPNKRMLMVFTERATPGVPFVSRVAADTRAVDRAIFDRYFPAAAKGGVPAGENLWVLLNRAGNVLRSGEEPIDPPRWNRMLESRFSGIRTEGLTVTPITDGAGKPLQDRGGKNLQLHSVWLAPDSPLPTGD